MSRMGARASLELNEVGFAPVGGGSILCRVEPCDGFHPAEWIERGDLVASRIRVPIRQLPVEIGGRMLDAALAAFPCEDASVEGCGSGPGKGVACLVEARFESGTEITSTFGELRVSAEKVGRRAAKMMNDFIGNGAAVGRHLADQLLLPMALAGGGRFTTMPPDNHVPTNIAVIEKFLPVKFEVTQKERICEISVRSERGL
jgi:RNA 3'-terminal phosphate cyclase (ATP)